MEEIFVKVSIPEFAENYLISNTGKVYSKHRNRLLTPKLSKSGYHRVTLCNNNYQKVVAIHRLVALAFIPNPDNKPTVNHINEIKTDNRVINLEWATNAEQNVHGTRLERARSHTDYQARHIDYKQVAAKHDYNKLASLNSKATIVYLNGKEVGRFVSQKEAARFTGVSDGKVSQCLSGKKKSCKGYVFKYLDRRGNTMAE